MNGLQEYWMNHLRGLGRFRNGLNFSDQLSDIITEINHFMMITVQV